MTFVETTFCQLTKPAPQTFKKKPPGFAGGFSEKRICLVFTVGIGSIGFSDMVISFGLDMSKVRERVIRRYRVNPRFL